MHRKTIACAVALAALAVIYPSALADAPARPWSNVVDFGLVMTGGNTQTSSFSFGDTYTYKWPTSDLTLQAAAIRAESKDRTVTNVDGVAVESRTSRTTAETYSFDGKYRHTVSDRLFWYAITDWLQNRLSGIDQRLTGGGGLGYQFVKTDDEHFSGEVGASWTHETRVASDTLSFAGARAFVGYDRKLSANSKFSTALELLDNLKDTADLRAKWITAVAGKLTAKLALQASFTVLYANKPVEEKVYSTDPTVPYALFAYDKTDTILATSLVWTF